MNKTKAKGVARKVFTKNNYNYLVAEGGGALLAYFIATITTVLLNNLGFSIELNVLGTFIAMSLAFWFGNMLTHRLAFSYHNKIPYPKQYSKILFKTNVKGSIITGIVQIIMHYLILRTNLVPLYLSPLAAYIIPGFIGSIYRHIKKLKSMDLLEEAYLDTEAGTQRKGYKLRYGSLGDAWHFAEEHVTVAMANYRKTIDHIQTLAEKKRK